MEAACSCPKYDICLEAGTELAVSCLTYIKSFTVVASKTLSEAKFMSGFTPMAAAVQSTAQLTPDQLLLQKKERLSAEIQRKQIELGDAERTVALLRQQLRDSVCELQTTQQQLDQLYITEDSELTKLLALKLPNITRGIECQQDKQNQKLLIKLLFCDPEDAPRVNHFFCAFLNDEDFLVEAKIGTWHEGPFNNPFISVTAKLTDREKLVNGLKLATPIKHIQSSQFTARC